GRARCFEIGCAAGVEYASEMIGERRLAALHGGEMQQSDINPASLARIEPLIERLPGVTEDRTREQLVAEYGVSEGLRLSDQRADQVAIVDDALRRPVALEVAPRHGQHRRDPEIADQAIIVDVHLHAAADQARGHGVEDVAHRDRARSRHGDGGAREIRGAMRRQREQRSKLNSDLFPPPGILAGDELLEEGLVGSEVGEVPSPAQFECLIEAGLQMAVRGLDRAVLVADAGIVAGWLHAVMATELGIARRLIVSAGQVAVSRREPVGAMRARHPAELPERLLDAFGERGEALAAADRLDVLPAAEGEPEMIQQMGERLATEGNAQPAAVGEIRQ